MKIVLSLYNALVVGLAAISGILLVALVLGISAEAMMRTLNLGVVHGVVDLTEYALFNIAILTAPWILRHNGHIRVNVLVNRLSPHSIRIADILINIFGFAVCAIILYFGLITLAVSFERGQYIFKELIIPDWWLQWQIPLGAFLLCIEFAVLIKNGIKAVISGQILPHLEEGL